jgi:osmotically inducible protein OsmC
MTAARTGRKPEYCALSADLGAMHALQRLLTFAASGPRNVDGQRAIFDVRETVPIGVSIPESGAEMIKKASAVWKGGFKDGGGTISTETGVLNEVPYGFKARFEDGKGTNPEELIGAAHAGCFSMALSLLLGEAGLTAESIETRAAVSLDKVGGGFEITASHLDVVARIPGADQAKFLEIADKAKVGCPVSKLLKARITMDAKLVS